MISKSTVDRYVTSAKQAESIRMKMNGLPYDEPATLTCCLANLQTLAEASAAVGRARKSAECYDYFDYRGVRFYALRSAE